MQDDFFSDRSIKKLRHIAGGDTYTIIYLKMLLYSLRTDGYIYSEGVEDTMVEEIALAIDEVPDNVSVTVNFLKSVGLLVETPESVFLNAVPAAVGSETQAALRMRRRREMAGNSTQRNIVTQARKSVTGELHPGNAEIEKEIELETDTEKERASAGPPAPAQVEAYAREIGGTAGAGAFLDYYGARGWQIAGQPIADWKSLFRTWVRREAEFQQQKKPPKAPAPCPAPQPVRDQEREAAESAARAEQIQRLLMGWQSAGADGGVEGL